MWKFVQDHISRLVPDAEQQNHYADYFPQFGTILENSRFVNPQKVKRILNWLLPVISQYEQIDTNIKLRQFSLSEYPIPNLVPLNIMAEYFPELFQLFLYDPQKAETARQQMNFNAHELNASKFE